MKKHNRKNKKGTSGITLIALVVTIVILLILAGVSINLVLGPNGLITRAQEAAQKTNQAIEDEKNLFNSLSNEIYNWGGNSITGGDKTQPMPANISLSATETVINATITATVTLSDAESEVDVQGSKWIYNTTSTEIGTEESNYTEIFTTNPETINLQTGTAGTYYLHILTKDKAGNKSETISEAITVKQNTGPIEDILKEGDYVIYPSPKGNLECRVLYDSSSSYGIQIITSDSVQDVTIGSWSNYSTAKASWDKCLTTLNNTAVNYNNSKYSTARCVGSNPTNPNSDTEANYGPDFNQMGTLEIRNICKGYWLASRLDEVINSHEIEYMIRIINENGQLKNCDICQYDSTSDPGWRDDTYGLRPVFTLKSGVNVTGGNGMSGSPYTLGI